MASATLYAPSISTYASAFNKDDDLYIYFSPSAYNTKSFTNVQLTVKYNSDNVSALKRDYALQRTGVRLNVDYHYNKETDQYYIIIPSTWIGQQYIAIDKTVKSLSEAIPIENYLNKTVKVENGDYYICVKAGYNEKSEPIYNWKVKYQAVEEGWVAGQVYKIQIRLSSVEYTGGNTQQEEAEWITQNSDFFSEWSTVCITKAVGDSHVTMGVVDFDSDASDAEHIHNKRTCPYYFKNDELNIEGTYSNDDATEFLYKYQLQLYTIDDELIEDSGWLYKGQFDNVSTFSHRFKRDLDLYTTFYVKLNIETINGYTDSYKTYIYVCPIRLEENTLQLLFVDNLAFKHLPDELTNYADGSETLQQKYEGETPDHRTVRNYLTTLDRENENGWIAYKLYSDDGGEEWDGQIIVKRTDEDSDFLMYDNINIIPLYNTQINDLPVFYDMTAQSGKSYRYAVQYVNRKGSKSPKLDKTLDIRRDYEHSYLLGANDLQLKLNYNVQLDSYTLHRSDNIFDTLGGKYPIITRNGNLGYKSFSLSGLISFNQDDCEKFLPRSEMYGYSKRERRDGRYEYDAELYKYYNLDEELPVYMDDFHYENMFREKVLQFLNDGKVKLFKSATELNMIVRITDVSLSPEQGLNRLIYNFQCTCTEVAEYNIENLKKYNLLTYYENTDAAQSDYETGYGVGQIIANVSSTTNLLQSIQNELQLDTTVASQQLKVITSIRDLKVSITSAPRIASTDSNSSRAASNLLNSSNNSQTTNIAGWQMQYESTQNQQDETILISPYNPNYNFDKNIVIPMVDENEDPIDFTTSNDGIYIKYDDKVLDSEGKDTSPNISVELNFVYSYYTKANNDVGKEVDTQELVTRFLQEPAVMEVNDDIMSTLRRYFYFDSDTNFQYLYYLEALKMETYPNAIFEITNNNENEEPHTQDYIIGPTGMLILNDYNVKKVTSIKYKGIMKYKDDTKTEYYTDTTSTIPVLFDCYCSVYKGTYKTEKTPTEA